MTVSSRLVLRASEVVPEKQAQPASYTRDRLTMLSFVLYGLWSFVWGLYAPIMPFLRSELKLSFSTAGLHFSALALGLLCAGIFGAGINNRFASNKVVWAGTAAIVAAIIGVIWAPDHYWSILSGLVVGFAGSLAGQAIIATTAQRFPAYRTTALAELIMVNSLFGACAPLTVAAVTAAGVPWRYALIAPIFVFIAAYALGKSSNQTFSVRRDVQHSNRTSLPRAYWFYFTILFLCVSAEWSIAFWCPEYLQHELHMKRAEAAAGLSVFLFAMLSGRFLGTRLTQRFSTRRLLVVATLTAAAGFLLFWCGHQAMLVFAGLVILGLGEANCYPLAMAAAIGTAPDRTAQATAKIAVSSGFAILLAPLFLGMAADHVGITYAYGIVMVLLIAAAGMALWSAKR